MNKGMNKGKESAKMEVIRQKRRMLPKAAWV